MVDALLEKKLIHSAEFLEAAPGRLEHEAAKVKLILRSLEENLQEIETHARELLGRHALALEVIPSAAPQEELAKPEGVIDE